MPVPCLRTGRPRQPKFPGNRVDHRCQKCSCSMVFVRIRPSEPTCLREITSNAYPASGRCVWAPVTVASSTAPRD